MNESTGRSIDAQKQREKSGPRRHMCPRARCLSENTRRMGSRTTFEEQLRAVDHDPMHMYTTGSN